jgi:hypothetical protein
MFFKQFYLGCLAQASYMIGSGGIAAVVDPRRDIDAYLEEAEKQHLRIRHVIEPSAPAPGSISAARPTRSSTTSPSATATRSPSATSR